MTGRLLANLFRSLRHRNYGIWAVGALISNIGTGCSEWRKTGPSSQD